MKLPILFLACSLILTPLLDAQQDPSIPPFYSVHAGLFFPAHPDFEPTFNASSDRTWGFGIGLPLGADFFYLMGDIAWFKVEGFLNPATDSMVTLEHRFIHVGLLNKQFFTPKIALRLLAGLNYNTVERKAKSPQSQEVVLELPKKIGYFGGIGIEQYLSSGQLSIHADILYDYRRSLTKELPGDFGGLRVELGASVYLF